MNGLQATIVIDLGFGDAGKGSVVDHLVRTGPVSAVVRFNGGAQAAHNVVLPDGRHHTFAQFGSGTFVPGVRTHLSRFMLVDPPALVREEAHLRSVGVYDAFARLSVDEAAYVVTPFQKAANRLREVVRGAGRHGSTGMGVGEAMMDVLSDPASAVYVRDLRDEAVLARKFAHIRERKREEFADALEALAHKHMVRDEVKVLFAADAPALFARQYWEAGMRMRIVPGSYLARLARRGGLVFEGAQGVLLDEWYGFHPYTTWSTVTPANARLLLREIGYDGAVETLGVLRGYFTRHGRGPFPTEDVGLTATLPDTHNGTGRWQEGFRVGWFDAVLARYAVAVSGGVNALVVTNLDRLRGLGALRIAIRYALADGVGGEERRMARVCGQERVCDLRVKRTLEDLVYQERLTDLLTRATPDYMHVPADTDAYLDALERSVGVPVGLTSFGPTHLEKRAGAYALRRVAA